MIKGWPDSFDVRGDRVFEERIRPFIEEQMVFLAAYDRKRQALNPETKYIFHEHAQRVAQDVRDTCAWFGLPESVQENMYWAMLAHDIGKPLLPVALWDLAEKPGAEEMKLRRSHVDLGLKVVEESLGNLHHPFIGLMKDIIANHHERMDGQGEHGLRADEISLPVRLACIVESYDGYTIPRPHFGDRDISPRGVLDKMRDEPGKGAAMFDMGLFEAFAEMKLDGKVSVSPAQAPEHGPKQGF